MSLGLSPVSSKILIQYVSKAGLQCQWHQSCRHMSMFTVLRSSDDHVLSSRTKI